MYNIFYKFKQKLFLLVFFTVIVLVSHLSGCNKNKSDYWLSHTGVIHNKSCRFYKSVKGSYIHEYIEQYRNCKRCGGFNSKNN